MKFTGWTCHSHTVPISLFHCLLKPVLPHISLAVAPRFQTLHSSAISVFHIPGKVDQLDLQSCEVQEKTGFRDRQHPEKVSFLAGHYTQGSPAGKTTALPRYPTTD